MLEDDPGVIVSSPMSSSVSAAPISDSSIEKKLIRKMLNETSGQNDSLKPL